MAGGACRQSDAEVGAGAAVLDEPLADRVLGWLADVRRFAPAELGFDWLMQLVARSEPRYHDFAVETADQGVRPGRLRPAAAGAAAAAPQAPRPRSTSSEAHRSCSPASWRR